MAGFTVTYRIFAADRATAQARAKGIALEQTVEIPRDIVPPGEIEDQVLGQVEEIGAEAEDCYRARIRYTSAATGPDLPQLLNVIFGNSSIQSGLKVVGFDPGDLPGYPGANFGIAGIRARAACPKGPLIAPVLKPMGSSPEELATLAYRCARAGAQIIKEDHGLADQPAAPFAERVPRIAEAVARANAETGGQSLYVPCLSGASETLMAKAARARDVGADGFLVMPGLHGFDLAHRLARGPDPLPVMAHPSFLGPYVLSRDTGFTHAMMFGTLQRLAGVDISVFPNVGGRFGFTAEECRAIARACQSEDGIGPPILPSPGGGMSPERAADMVKMYGSDAVFLLGGSLLRSGERIEATIAELIASVT